MRPRAAKTTINNHDQLLTDLRARYDHAVAWGITTNRHRTWAHLISACNHSVRPIDAIHSALIGNPWLLPVSIA